MPSPPSANDQRKSPELTVAIDFGSSYSKVSIACNSETVHSARFNDLLVVPTVLYVSPGGSTTIDEPAATDGDWRKLERFKLFLLRDQDIPPQARRSQVFQETANAIHEADMDAVALTAVYLRHLWDKSSVNIAKMLRPARLQDHHMRVIATIPAVWHQDVVGRMKQAVLDSGILDAAREATLEFMPETKAAAIFSLTSIARYPSTSAHHEVIVICDCGGLTADVSIYEVMTAPNENYIVDKCVTGVSRLCGGEFLNEGFSRLLAEKICSATGDPLAMRSVDGHFLKKALIWWENLVCNLLAFPAASQTVTVNEALVYPGLEPSYLGASGHYISFSGAEIESILRPIVTKIIALVRSQIGVLKKRYGWFPNYHIILTGGMGCNAILERMLVEQFGPSVEVIRWADGRERIAVSTGATLHHARSHDQSDNAAVVASIIPHEARASYGIRQGKARGGEIDWAVFNGSGIPTIPRVGMHFTVPRTSISKQPDINGDVWNVFTVCYNMLDFPHASDSETFCTVSWPTRGVADPSRDAIVIGFSQSSLHSVKVTVYCNGHRLNDRLVSVDYSFTTDFQHGSLRMEVSSVDACCIKGRAGGMSEGLRE